MKKKAPNTKNFRRTKKTKMEKTIDKEVVKVLKNQAETKYSITLSNTNIANITSGSAQVVPLNAIAQGTTDTTRIGSEIGMKSLDLRGQFYNAAAFTTTSNACTLARVMIVKEKPALGSAIQVGSLFAYGPTPTCPLNLTARAIKGRYQILYDKTFTVGNQNTNNGQVSFHIKKKLNFKTYFRGTGATAADIDQNSLSMIVFTDNATTNALNMNFGYAVGYTDE